jgi:hypothetical protein
MRALRTRKRFFATPRCPPRAATTSRRGISRGACVL